MTAVLTLLGALMVLLALRDVFDTLLHPHGKGVISERLIRAVWSATRRIVRGDHRVLSLAGPAAFIGVILVWGSLVVFGFAFILWPQLPDHFAFHGGLERESQSGYVDALYLSLVNLASLGYGDIVPTSDLLRLLGPLETLIGLGLLTASISWILLLYRVLSDYRSLSHEISLLIQAEHSSGIDLAAIEPSVAAGVLSDLTTRVVAVRDDFVHSPIAYYFHPRDPRHALPVLLPGLLEVVDRCSAADRPPALRFQAALLGDALEDLLSTIAAEFLRRPGDDPAQALAVYRRDHLWASG